MTLDSSESGEQLQDLIRKLYPICRSITGDGVRESLKILKEHVPLEVKEVPTGTSVFDWKVPKEWNIRDAYVKNSKGEKVIDFKKCNLHVLNYSVPIMKNMALSELKEHLYTLPDFPDWIPYRTSYYKENWGFCLSHMQFSELKDEEYEVCIDSTLEDGYLTYGEYYLPGRTSDEVLISTHICHPSLCNDNLSGVAVATFLAKSLGSLSLRYSYRFLYIPGTIGSITWLASNEKRISSVKHGMVLACLGDAGKATYKKSRRGNAQIDRAAMHVLKHSGKAYEIMDFFPYGYDERQFCSPGFNLPIGCFMRTPHGKFPEYHTSADDLHFVKPEYLADSLAKCISLVHILEHNQKFINQNPKCEPQLGKRGLYGTTSGNADGRVNELAMLWVLNLSDGNHTLLDVAEKSGLDFNRIKEAADALSAVGLLIEDT